MTVSDPYSSAQPFTSDPAQVINSAPVIADPGDLEIYTGQQVWLPLSVTDADGDSITWDVRNLPPGLTFDPVATTISGTVGALTGLQGAGIYPPNHIELMRNPEYARGFNSAIGDSYVGVALWIGGAYSLSMMAGWFRATPAVVASPGVQNALQRTAENSERLAGAAQRLAVNLNNVQIQNGVARVSVGHVDTINRADIRTLIDHLARNGATTVRLEAMLQNPRLSEFLLNPRARRLLLGLDSELNVLGEVRLGTSVERLVEIVIRVTNGG
ncbi:MAG: putative Ig domain-containing protein [Gemmataceae bacterium]|nr:putative Ig domain-containing protein [Gemmataceae bacterium]